MKLVLSNSSSDNATYAGGLVVVPAKGSLDVSSSYWFALYNDTNFIRDIRLHNLGVNDGNGDIPQSETESYIKQINEFNYNNKDIDGALVVRSKAAKKGWSFWAVPIEFTTSTIGGTLYCKNAAEVNIPGITCKIYDSDNDEITTPGLAGINLAACVKTVVDFEPQFDFEIIGGALRINSNPSQDIRLWIIGAPDIPAIYGGSKEFASGVNLKFLAPDASFDIDGRVTKYLIYDPVTHQGKMRMLLRHPAGLQINMQIVVHVYRQ